MVNTPRCKQCRREGKKLFLKGERCNGGKCAIVKRNYPPGMQGNRGFKKLTEYGIQLREKQHAKRVYGVSETQFKNYYNEAIRKKEDTGPKIIELLEMRFDNIVYRLGIAKSRKEARQMVRHGLFTLNDKKADIPSMQLKPGDVIKIKKTKENKKIFQNLEKRIDLGRLSSWLAFDVQNKEVKITGKPNVKEVNPSFDLKLVVEYYSRV